MEIGRLFLCLKFLIKLNNMLPIMKSLIDVQKESPTSEITAVAIDEF